MLLKHNASAVQQALAKNKHLMIAMTIRTPPMDIILPCIISKLMDMRIFSEMVLGYIIPQQLLPWQENSLIRQAIVTLRPQNLIVESV